MPGKSLDPSVHLIVGILVFSVSAYSLIFLETPNPSAMRLFMYIGLGFIVLAGIKYLFRYLKSGSLKKSEEKFAEKLSGLTSIEAQYQKQHPRSQAIPQHNPQRTRAPSQQSPQQQPEIIICPLCRTRNYKTSNYCHMCGYKLK